MYISCVTTKKEKRLKLNGIILNNPRQSNSRKAIQKFGTYRNEWSDYEFFGDGHFFLWRVKSSQKGKTFFDSYVSHVLELHKSFKKSYQPAFYSRQNQSYDCFNM